MVATTSMNYCALCCMAKDEDLYLKEWLAYHARIGFEHFIIYDDLSTRPIVDLLSGWCGPGDVTVIRNERHLSQTLAYSHCLERFGSKFVWIAFLDLDEFLRLAPDPFGERQDIRLFLAEFEPYAGLGVNWRMFSSSGHETRPRGTVTGSYTHCLGDDIHIKSIVQPAKIKACDGPHSFSPKPGHRIVNAEHCTIPSGFPLAVPETRRIAVNHYYYKSRQCFAAKILRGNPCLIERRMEAFDRHLTLPVTVDADLLPLAEEVRDLLMAPRLAPATGRLFLPLEELGKQPSNSLGNARARLKESAGRNDLVQALLHLCYVSYLNSVDGNPDPMISLELWTLRAQAARLSGDLPLARRCLNLAFQYGPGDQTYAELAGLLLEEREPARAKQALEILRALSRKES